MIKLLFFSNLPTPYQFDFLKQLNINISAKAIFLYENEPNRDWKLGQSKNLIILNYVSTNQLEARNKLIEELISEMPDRIIIGGYNLPLIKDVVSFARSNQIPFYFWLERPHRRHWLVSLMKQMYFRFVFGRSKGILAIGRLAFDIYKHCNKNVINFPYNMDLKNNYLIERKNKKETSINFLYLGQFIHRKNLENMILAFNTIDFQNASLTLIGSGQLRSQLEIVSKGNANIRILNFIQTEEKIEMFARYDVLVIPSFHDGWGVVVAEAMATGMGIIGSRHVGAVVDYIEHERNGYICDVSVDSIREAFKFYIRNTVVAREHGLLNRNIIKNSLSDTENACRFLINKLGLLR